MKISGKQITYETCALVVEGQASDKPSSPLSSDCSAFSWMYLYIVWLYECKVDISYYLHGATHRKQ
jgi:hypothetical protein